MKKEKENAICINLLQCPYNIRHDDNHFMYKDNIRRKLGKQQNIKNQNASKQKLKIEYKIA